MSEPPISLRDLRERIEHGIEIEDIVPARNLATLDWHQALALVEAVEAALEYGGEMGHSWRCEYRTAEKGWKAGDPPVIECCCGLDRLEAALARFSDVGTEVREEPGQGCGSQEALSHRPPGGGVLLMAEAKKLYHGTPCRPDVLRDGLLMSKASGPCPHIWLAVSPEDARLSGEVVEVDMTGLGIEPYEWQLCYHDGDIPPERLRAFDFTVEASS